SGKQSPGVTGVVLTGLLKTGKLSARDPMIEKGLKYVESLINPEKGHIAGKDPRLGLQNYVTCVNVMALVSADRDSYKKVVKAEDGMLPGYGNMTYAGIKSMIYCGVPEKDERIKKAYQWIRKHYTVEENPGMPKVRRHWGLFYYYHTMAKCLDVLGIDYVEDDKGIKHDWRADITRALAEKQQSNGSFTNDQDRWMEGD